MPSYYGAPGLPQNTHIEATSPPTLSASDTEEPCPLGLQLNPDFRDINAFKTMSLKEYIESTLHFDLHGSWTKLLICKLYLPWGVDRVAVFLDKKECRARSASALAFLQMAQRQYSKLEGYERLADSCFEKQEGLMAKRKDLFSRAFSEIYQDDSYPRLPHYTYFREYIYSTTFRPLPLVLDHNGNYLDPLNEACMRQLLKLSLLNLHSEDQNPDDHDLGPFLEPELRRETATYNLVAPMAC